MFQRLMHMHASAAMVCQLVQNQLQQMSSQPIDQHNLSEAYVAQLKPLI